MIRHRLGGLTALLALAATTSPGQPAGHWLIHQRWFEARTAHFHIYSCGPTQEVARLVHAAASMLGVPCLPRALVLAHLLQCRGTPAETLR